MMTERPRANNRIQSIECCRLIASVMVLLAHFRGSGYVGIIIDCLARFTVPFFFAVSGYFAYRAGEKTMGKRLRAVIKLTITANLLYLLWGAWFEGIRDFQSFAEWTMEIYSNSNLAMILLINRSPVASHLWYLNSIVLCYAAMWIYVRWAENETCNYKPLYLTGVCFYALHVVLSSFATACGLELPYHLYRNALLTGLPMFALGIFLREYQDKIIRVYHLTEIKVIGLIAAGAFLSLFQWRGTGAVEMPVGALLEVIGLMLLVVMVPVVSKDSGILSGIISTFGQLSTYVYITHMLWGDVYGRYMKASVLQLGEAAETFLCPIVVLGLTLTTGVLYMGIMAWLKRFSGKMLLPRKRNKG